VKGGVTQSNSAVTEAKGNVTEAKWAVAEADRANRAVTEEIVTITEPKTDRRPGEMNRH
jgi:hypothetical protein